MSIKMFCTDLDGTLLNDEKRISQKNKEALHQFLDMGHYLVIVTGRAISSVRTVMNDMDLMVPGVFVIGYNGAIVYDCSANKTLREVKFPIRLAEYLFMEAEQAGIYIQTYDGLHVLSPKKTPELEWYLARTNMPVRYVDNVFDLLSDEPPKVLLIGNHEKLIKFQEDHKEWEKGRCVSFFSDDRILEYCPLEATKGQAIHFLSDFLNVPYESTYAIGDHDNDLSMIKEAYTGIAMANAIPALKEAADFVTEYDNNHDGFAEVIQKFFL